MKTIFKKEINEKLILEHITLEILKSRTGKTIYIRVRNFAATYIAETRKENKLGILNYLYYIHQRLNFEISKEEYETITNIIGIENIYKEEYIKGGDVN